MSFSLCTNLLNLGFEFWVLQVYILCTFVLLSLLIISSYLFFAFPIRLTSYGSLNSKLILTSLFNFNLHVYHFVSMFNHDVNRFNCSSIRYRTICLLIYCKCPNHGVFYFLFCLCLGLVPLVFRLMSTQRVVVLV